MWIAFYFGTQRLSHSNDQSYASVTAEVLLSVPVSVPVLARVSIYRTSTLILDLLSAVCHFKNLNGHNKVIEAVDAFAVCKGEAHRFQTLVYHFYDSSCPMEFRVSWVVCYCL